MNKKKAILVHYRSVVELPYSARSLWSKSLDGESWDALYSESSRVFKDNVSRLYTAAQWALEEDAVLVVVEGWGVQEIACAAGRIPQNLTGSEMSGRILRMFLRRDLLDLCPPLLLEGVSRCTAEEVAVAYDLCAERGLVFIGAVAGRSCPSVVRAKKYYKLLGVHVSLRGGSDTRYYAPSYVELFLDWILERINWVVYGLSFGGDLRRRMEARLARKLRKNVKGVG